MIRRSLQLILLAGALLVPLGAQPRPPVAWWENPVASGLTLSDAQLEKIRNIVNEFSERLDLERQEADRAELELESAVDADNFDWRRGRLAIDQLVKARAAYTQDVSLMMLRLRGQLTAEQWRVLQLRREEGRGREGRGGKGPRPDGRGRRPESPAIGSQPTSSPAR